FVCDVVYALKMVGAHTLLGSGHEVSSQHPLVEWDLGALEHGADRNREGLTAFIALIDAGACGLPFQLSDAGLVGVLAMRADRTIGPVDGLKVFASLLLVVVDRCGQVEHCRNSLRELSQTALGTS